MSIDPCPPSQPSEVNHRDEALHAFARLIGQLAAKRWRQQRSLERANIVTDEPGSSEEGLMGYNVSPPD